MLHVTKEGCPYRITRGHETAAGYRVIYLDYPSHRIMIAVDPSILTRRRLFDFIEDIRDYAQGQVSLLDVTGMRYDEERPGVVTLYSSTTPQTMTIALCQELLDVLEELAT